MDNIERISNKIKRMGMGAMLVGVMSVSLVACGGEASPAAPAATEPTATTAVAAATAPSESANGGGAMTESTVALSEWAVTPKGGEVTAGKVKFNVTNEGQFTHNLVILEGTSEVGRTPNFMKDEGPKVLEVDLKPGTYTWLCDITGHPDKGMMGTLTVK